MRRTQEVMGSNDLVRLPERTRGLPTQIFAPEESVAVGRRTNFVQPA